MKTQTLRMRLSIWQDSQDKRSSRSITCFVRKWKEKVAWPRLTKEDIKVCGEWLAPSVLSVHPLGLPLLPFQSIFNDSSGPTYLTYSIYCLPQTPSIRN